MRRSATVLVPVFVCSVLLHAQSTPSASDPILGSWKENVAKSTYSPGPPPPASGIQVRQYRADDEGSIRYVLVSANPPGNSTFQASVFKVDGRQYPVYNTPAAFTLLTTGKPTNVTRSYRRIDQYTVEFITYTGGVAGLPTLRVISQDGKTYTDTTAGKNQQGQAIHNVVVFDRVQ